MRLVTVSDIFGRTRHFEKLSEHLADTYDSVDLVDPYGGNPLNFQNEHEAYSHFQTTIGLEKYRDILLDHLQDTKHTEYHLIGFSIGASAIWLISELLNFHEKTRATCFYSSQIRNYLEVWPQLNIDLYFPVKEAAFEINVIMEKLFQRPNVQCYQTGYHHGFMNKLSVNYNKDGYDRYMAMLKSQKAAG